MALACAGICVRTVRTGSAIAVQRISADGRSPIRRRDRPLVGCRQAIERIEFWCGCGRCGRSRTIDPESAVVRPVSVAKQSPHPSHSPSGADVSGKEGNGGKAFARAGANEFKSEHSPRQ